MKKITFTILRPGGNDTALVEGIVNKKEKKRINDEIMRQYLNVEQVGFYEFDKNSKIGRLEMAGGEFCGNATRSLSYLLLKEQKGIIPLNVSGTNQLLDTGIKKLKTAYAQMPIENSFDSVKKLKNNLWLVEIEGISHLITYLMKPLSQNSLKTKAQILLKKNNLLSTLPASGVMFVKKLNNQTFEMQPIVWVRDIKTLFYETACASGVAAIGLWILKENKKNSLKIFVIQPTGQIIAVKARKNKKRFIDAYIDGPISIVQRGEQL